jgi:hypothetical protein
MVALVAAACGDDKGGDDSGESQPTITTVNPSNPSAASETVGSGSSSSGDSGSITGSGTPTTTDLSTGGDPTGASTSTAALDDTGVPATSTTGDPSTGEPIKFDAGVQLDIPPPVCLQCALTIASQQSGVLATSGDHVFATAKLMDKVVYALGTYGGGRFIAAADSSLPFNEQTDCPISEWLAGNGGVQPKILYFGWGPSDGPKQWNVPSDAAGIHLPAQYIGNPDQLLADYDIVMYLEGSGQFGMDAPSDQEMTTLLDYLEKGGGMYISSEFYGYLNDADLVSVNRLLTPLGATTQPVSLNWGNVDGQIDFECFPEPQ